MAKLAVDIALLPTEEAIDKIIEVNRKMINPSIMLDKKDCLPHITLCMGVLEEGNLKEAEKIITSIAQGFKRMRLNATLADKEWKEFTVENAVELQKLHEAIMTEMKLYLSYDATVETCYKPLSIDGKTLNWINSYKETSSFGNFRPHITLGQGKLGDRQVDLEFEAARVVICHLGSNCTCCKVLGFAELKK